MKVEMIMASLWEADLCVWREGKGHRHEAMDNMAGISPEWDDR